MQKIFNYIHGVYLHVICFCYSPKYLPQHSNYFSNQELFPMLQYPYEIVFKSIDCSILTEIQIGGEDIIFMAGPYTVESYEQMQVTARAIRKASLHIIRRGVFKPRTSPYTFQGLGKEGLIILRQVADEFGLLIISEALGVEHVDLVCGYADIIQIDSRNMQLFPLFWDLGEFDKSVMLKHGCIFTIEEWLLAAEHITTRGNESLPRNASFDPLTKLFSKRFVVPFVSQW